MRNRHQTFRDRDIASVFGVWRFCVSLIVVLICPQSLAADGLWIENPTDVAYSVGDLTADARKLGLSDNSLVETLSATLTRAGLIARPAEFARDQGVLFLDIIVENQTFYASLGFWRVATFPRPDGEPASDFVIVWQDYSVGSHHNNAAAVNHTVQKIIDRFVVRYSTANKITDPLQAAATP
jgi:hypothetical protein